MNEVNNHNLFKMADYNAFMLSLTHLSLYDLWYQEVEGPPPDRSELLGAVWHLYYIEH